MELKREFYRRLSCSLKHALRSEDPSRLKLGWAFLHIDAAMFKLARMAPPLYGRSTVHDLGTSEAPVSKKNVRPVTPLGLCKICIPSTQPGRTCLHPNLLKGIARESLPAFAPNHRAALSSAQFHRIVPPLPLGACRRTKGPLHSSPVRQGWADSTRKI
jgi:hypothetical protein